MLTDSLSGPYLRRGYGIIPPPKCSPQKISTPFQQLSILIPYCIFFLPKAFCNTQKVLKRRLRPGLCHGPGRGAHDAPPGTRLGRGQPSQITHVRPSTPSASRCRRIWRLSSVNHLPIFSSYSPAECRPIDTVTPSPTTDFYLQIHMQALFGKTCATTQKKRKVMFFGF